MYDLKEFKEVFDPILNEFIDQKINDYLEKTNDPFIKDFIFYSKNLITGGGKRIRPYIAYLTYKSLGGIEDKKVMQIFIGLELFHNFCLIHDDVIDKSVIRHGQKTIHKYVLENLKKDKRVGHLEHIGNSQGILIGDLLFSWSMEIFSENGNCDLENSDKARMYFYKMIDEVVLGQIIDVDLSTRENPNWDLIEEKTRLKTSRYSFVRPMQIGGVLANPNHEMDNFFEDFGTKLGVAFQIQDDMLDIIGNPKEIRKTPLIDVAEHQHTFFTNYVLEHGTKYQKEYFGEIFGKTITKDKYEKIRNLFKESGAIDEGKKLIEQNFSFAVKIVKDSELKEEYKQNFYSLIDLIKNRQN